MSEFVYPQDTLSQTSHEERAVYLRIGGLTLRDYFAAKTIRSAHEALFRAGGVVSVGGKSKPVNAETIATYCYEIADAMLVKRAVDEDAMRAQREKNKE